MFKINWDNIFASSLSGEILQRADREITRLLENYNSIPLDDLLSRKLFGGQMMIERLFSRYGSNIHRAGQYKIHFDKVEKEFKDGRKWVCNLFPAEPGDIYFNLLPLASRMNGKGKIVPVTGSMENNGFNLSKTRGDEHDPRDWDAYTLDENCEIVCPLNVALDIYLSYTQWGRNIPDDRWVVRQIEPNPINIETKPKPKGRPPKAI
jgi:hypothetical protein